LATNLAACHQADWELCYKSIMQKNDFTSPETLLAAVDLGSNSFRLEIGRYENGQIQRVDYLKEAVRQGGDLDEERNLKPEAIERH